MTSIEQRAAQLREETVAHRRYLHTNAETGLETPRAVAYLMEKLKEYGLAPQRCGHGVTASLGHGGETLLLRADMDALPMPEESGEAFACPTGAQAHACGHDFHAAMLLTAAKILKENEDRLKGTVRFMFQPAEETFEGAADMIACGVLDGVAAALAFHVAAGRALPGLFMYNSGGVMMSSVDGFRINVHGHGAHGAYPHSSVDPINIAVHIYLALEALIAREADPSKNCVLTVGSFSAGSAPNIIPDTACLSGTLRTNDRACRELLLRRIREAAERTAEAYGGTVTVEALSAVPPLICDSALTDRIAGYLGELTGLTGCPGISASASEDFATIADRVPGTFMYLSAGFDDERGDAPAHNPKVRFNEDVCAIGPACLAHCAIRYFQDEGENAGTAVKGQQP
ncbi:MAG: M20 family metallopeptidase [Butyricicoccus sp.]|nr:M20 family metallopeptidase [Butyricicoccus sp.]